MNKLEKLIEQGKEVGSNIPLDKLSVLAGEIEFNIPDKQSYYNWLAKVKLFLGKNFKEHQLTAEFLEWSQKITPMAHIQMLSILEALKEEYEESPSVDDILQELDRLERNYIKAREAEKNSAEAIDCFDKWYKYAIKTFYNAIGDRDPDFERLKDINTGANGYGLSYAFDRVMANYVVLKEKLKNPPKSAMPIRFVLPMNTNTTQRKDKTSIFISYSHKDKDYLEWFQKHLKAFQRQNRHIEVWDDTKLKAGDRWKEEIKTALKDASVAFLLVSKDYLASDFVMDEEIPTLLQKCSDEGTLIIPIILKPCLFEDSPIGGFQAINAPDIPLAAMSESDVDQVFVDLLRQVKKRVG